MERFLVIMRVALVFMFLVVFPGLSTLFATSQVREDLVEYCQNTSPLVEREIEMYQLYERGDSYSIQKKAQMAGSELISYEPQTEEVYQLYKRYLLLWDNWANDNVADLFGYGREDNALIRYHEDVLKLAYQGGGVQRRFGAIRPLRVE